MEIKIRAEDLFGKSKILPFIYIRLLFHVFGYVDFEHFIGNDSYLLLLEEKYSSKAIMLVIGITVVITGGFNSLFFADVALCGASSVVFALNKR